MSILPFNFCAIFIRDKTLSEAAQNEAKDTLDERLAIGVIPNNVKFAMHICKLGGYIGLIFGGASINVWLRWM